MPPQHRSSGFDLIQSGGVAQVEQTIHLGRVPAQAAGEFGFFDTLLVVETDCIDNRYTPNYHHCIPYFDFQGHIHA